MLVENENTSMGVSLLSDTLGLSHLQPEGSCRGQETVMSTDRLQVKQAGQVSSSWKGHVVGKGQNRTGQVRHFTWVFPAGLLGDTPPPKNPTKVVGFTTSTCVLLSFPNFFSQRLQVRALLVLHSFLALPHPTQPRDPAFCTPQIWFEVGVSYAFLPKAIAPTITPADSISSPLPRSPLPRPQCPVPRPFRGLRLVHHL